MIVLPPLVIGYEDIYIDDEADETSHPTKHANNDVKNADVLLKGITNKVIKEAPNKGAVASKSSEAIRQGLFKNAVKVIETDKHQIVPVTPIVQTISPEVNNRRVENRYELNRMEGNIVNEYKTGIGNQHHEFNEDYVHPVQNIYAQDHNYSGGQEFDTGVPYKLFGDPNSLKEVGRSKDGHVYQFMGQFIVPHKQIDLYRHE